MDVGGESSRSENCHPQSGSCCCRMIEAHSVPVATKALHTPAWAQSSAVHSTWMIRTTNDASENCKICQRHWNPPRIPVKSIGSSASNPRVLSPVMPVGSRLSSRASKDPLFQCLFDFARFFTLHAAGPMDRLLTHVALESTWPAVPVSAWPRQRLSVRADRAGSPDKR